MITRAPTRPCRDGVVPTQDWKSRPIPTLQGTGILTEELEESIMQMQTFLTMRHVAPFREEATELLANLNDAADTLEQWVKVQLMWCSLESVFTGGDIAKQPATVWKLFASRDLGAAVLGEAQTRTRRSSDTLDRLERAAPHANLERTRIEAQVEL